MLYIFRLIITMIYSILVYVFGSIYCFFNPRNPRHVATFRHMFGRLVPLFGLKVEYHKPTDAESYDNAIYIASHQNNYDMVAASNITQPPTVTIGKESLLWVPFFGQLYQLVGSLLIDRNSRIKAHGTTAGVVNHFKKRRVSIWMFPEGTRSHGRGLLPFKTGVLHAAIAAGVLVIPIRVSTASNKINLNRLHNGLMIVEMLPPIDVSQYGRDRVRKLVTHYRSIMEQKIAELDKEIAEREAVGRV